MKPAFSTLAILALLIASGTSASLMKQQEAQAGCMLTGTYVNSNEIATCSNVVISNLQVPAGVTHDLTKVKSGATITFQGTTTFGKELWEGPLVLLTSASLTVNDAGVLDDQGDCRADSSTLSGFMLKNSSFRTFSILNSVGTHLTGLTLDSSAGDNHAKNTGGFDLSHNKGVHITNNIIHNQDDCLAMQSSTDTVFSGNSCTGSHGISVGSISRDVVNESSTVSGLIVDNSKTISRLVTGVFYTKNVLTNAKNAIGIHSNYVGDGSKGKLTSQATIRNITIAGLSGTATNLYDILVNPSVVSNWHFSGITVLGAKGTCEGQSRSITG